MTVSRDTAVTVLCALFLCLFFAPPAKAEEAGRVLSARAGAWIDQGGASKTAETKDSVARTAALRTDASGRMQVMLGDDGSVSLGSNTSFKVEEYLYGTAGKPVFRGHLGQGLMRVVTGRVVEQNPEGFRITTPEGTVGIRGTVCGLEALNGTTTLYVENTTKGKVYLNNTPVPAGQKAVLTGQGEIRVMPLTPADRARLSELTAVLRTRLGDRDMLADTGRKGIGIPELSELAAPDIGSLSVNPPSAPGLATASNTIAGPTSASYMGSTLGGAFLTTTTFGFNVALSSGAITNGYINGSGVAVGVFNGTGGTGSVVGGSFNVGGFTGLGASSSIQHMGGTFTPGDPSVLVDVIVQHPVNPALIDSGSGYSMTKQ